MGVQYLKRKDIDTEKWDQLVARSPAETLYAYSWYLDVAAEHWSALVLEDYSYVMALPWKRKFGLPYICQPIICQQLGLMGSDFPDPHLIRTFMDRFPLHFRFGTLQFNRTNLVEERKGFRVWDRSNHVLSLSPSYDRLLQAYSQNTRRNLKRALAAGAALDTEVRLEELMELKSQVDRPRRNIEWYGQVSKQLKAVLEHGEGRILGLRDRGVLTAAVFLAVTATRIIYLMPVSNSEGKEERAMFRIVDYVIREYAGSALTLDFEGSDIPGIARFFTGFGASPETYQAMDVRRFPFSIPKKAGNG